jgi:predicted secreted protein
VTFKDGATTLGTGTLNGSGQATFTASSLSVGTHSITASYSGDANNAASTSAPLSQVVGQGGTTTTLISSQNPSTFGQGVTFTATATGASPTGRVTFKDGATTLATVTLNGSGQATFTTSALSVGTHSITATYNGDANNASSTSAPLSQVVGQAPTTIALQSSVNPSMLGQAVTFTATVTGTSVTGTVTFKDGATTLATVTLNGSGQATFTTSALSVGTHSITASYSGDVDDAPSTSAPLNQVVGQGATTTTLISSQNPSPFGQSVTFTATVTGASPTGTVTFKDGATTLGTGTLNGSGQAMFTTSALSFGTHSITATYNGDANNAPSTSAPLSQVVGQAPTTTALQSSVNPSALGQSVTFTAIVTGTSVTGTVTFKDGATTLATVTLNGSGQATFTTSALSVGTHSITASYSGDVDDAPSTSAPLNQVVGKGATTTALISSQNPSALGQSVTFTATVNGSSPTGTVTFKDGATTLGTGTLNGSGQATFTTSALSLGTHSITAGYSGDANNAPSTSAPLSQVVGQASTTTTLLSSQNPITLGQAVTFTATVSGASPTGTVTFKDGATTLGTGTLNGSGQATFTTSALSVGTHSITATYNGDANNAASTSGTFQQVVNQIGTSTALQSSANPSIIGQAVTFTATVTGTSPTGTVTFKDGAITLGTGTLSSGKATFTTSALSLGTHSITATYNGDATNNPSTSAPLNQVVGPGATTTTLISSANPSPFGQSVTFTATVTGASPTGTVTFNDGATTLATVTLNGSGQATFTTSALSFGTHSITATYNGDANNASSTSAPLGQVVGQAPTSTALQSSVNPSALGQSVTFTATVTGTSVTGTVTFKDGATTLATVTLNGSGGSGQATFTTSALSVGTHTITASYSGDVDDAPSTSAPLNQVVGQGATTTALISSQNPSTFGQSVTFTATVTGSSPTGTVTFKDGATTLGTGTLNGSGQATFTTSALSLGTHSITATYNGDANNAASTSAPLNQVVGQAPTTTALQSSVNPSTAGQSVTFTATVTGTSVTGTVTFKDGATTLATVALNGSGQATFTTSALSVGTHSITASYSGDVDDAPSTSAPVNQAVNQGATTTTLISSQNPSPFGQAVTFTATVTGANPTGTVTFKDGATTLATVTLNGSGQAMFTTSALSAGTHTITATYNGDANNKPSTSAPLNQVVNKAPTTTTLTSSPNPSAFGQAVTFTATVKGSGGTPTGTVTFKVDGITIGTVKLNSSGIATLTVSSLAVGTHSITATYNGDANFTPSTSAVLIQVVSVPPDSIRLREMQIAAMPVIAQVSGDAISSAIDSAIAAGFSGRPKICSPNSSGFTCYYGGDAVSYAGDTIADRANESTDDFLKRFTLRRTAPMRASTTASAHSATPDGSRRLRPRHRLPNRAIGSPGWISAAPISIAVQSAKT